jgi:acyl-coenzyme A thioesterase PaaI-like protein
MDITKLSKKAEHSSFYRRVLSFGLNNIVPFNKPHGFAITAVSPNELTVRLPYKKRNLNHVKGLHACAMATLAEVSSGFLLLSRIDPKKYRIILHRLEMDYHYQGKTHAYARFQLTDDFLRSNILEPLEKEEKIQLPCTVEIHDEQKNHLATGIAHWQIKNWKAVKLKT